MKINESSDEYILLENEDYMSANQLQFFKNRLLAWQRELMAVSASFFEELRDNDLKKPDTLDQSALQAEILLDSSTRERQGKLLREIDLAIDRIEKGEYGYCEITGDEIGLKRLMAQPIATRCIEAQEQFEQAMNSKIRIAYGW